MQTNENNKLTTYVMEMSKGRFLHINSTEDGDGTWFDDTPSIWEAYWHDLDRLEEIANLEFSDFPPNYPKFHKMQFSMKCIKSDVLG